MEKGHGICPECLAGHHEAPFEQISWFPRWKATEGLKVPWDENNPSPLLKIPGRDSAPHLLFRKDCFHIWKQTIGGHWVASAIVLLLDLGYWATNTGPQDADSLLRNAYADFDFYVKKEFPGHQVANCKSFTKALLHWSRQKVFPFTRIKGSDIMLCTRWLNRVVQFGRWDSQTGSRSNRSFVQYPLDPSHVPFMVHLVQGCCGALDFFHVCHSEGVWHTRVSAQRVATGCFKFCDAYAKISALCHAWKLRRFHMEPSLHSFLHFAVDNAARLRCGDTFPLSPMAEGCEMDEDFVGRLARLSRAVHARSTCQRTLQRYSIKARFALTGEDWNSSGPSKKRKRKVHNHR